MGRIKAGVLELLFDGLLEQPDCSQATGMAQLNKLIVKLQPPNVS